MSFWGFNKLKKIGLSMGVSSLKNVTGTSKGSALNVILQGKITANVLNIRSAPSLKGEKLGKFTKGDIFSVLEETDNNWFRFKYDDKDAYVFGKYVSTLHGTITANVLNIRRGPGLDEDVVGKLKKGDDVVIAQITDNWIKIKLENNFGYVYAKYVSLAKDSNDSEKTGAFGLKDDQSLLRGPVEASKKISVPTSPRAHRATAETYNNFGTLLSKISHKLGLDPAAAIAVLAVESGGKAYGSEGKVIIRFENHLFHRFWGKNHSKIYNSHFKYSSGQSWKGHYFRKSKKDNWESFHGNQKKEWEVFEFAQSLNSSAAHLSTSYGAPQILGTNYKTVGYNSPEELLEYFSKDVRFHVLALFDFFNPQMVSHIKQKDFTAFARYYNGRGQAATYGKYIKDYYNAFKSMM
ncbi:MAG: N-acetylmuramidase domain-containing protein [Bacteroidota bacterium]|nr:N-acetylmuramidase domain-containing protein [Bacteroidota bacterium]